MPRTKQRTESEKRVNLDIDKETIRTLTIDAINRGLQGFKPNAERILKEAAEKINAKTK